MVVLALDMATKTGWALSCNGTLHSGVWNVALKKGEGAGMRLLRLENYIKEIYEQHHPSLIVFEHPIQYPGRHEPVGFTMMGVLTRWCEAVGFKNYTSYYPTQIKKHAVGGRANKELLLKLARERWPEQNIEDDNQADALWLLSLAQQESG